ncbi:MAG: type IV secretion system DNA-binding domain-containing protein, partial [Clostridia bacterium]|nr:type IV secretion system DNA-binding domain-containing protein [Clostridia bacterium]
GKCVFIEYDLGIGNMLSPIYSLLFDLAIKEALCRKKSEGNVYFITDEFSLIPNLQHVDDAVNFGRSLGVKFMLGIQNIDQVFENYGENRARSLLSGFLTSVCFRVNDCNSKEFIKNLFGVNRKKEIYMASVQGRGIVENVRDSNVVEDWDITRLQLGQAIIGLPGQEPFVFQFKKV